MEDTIPAGPHRLISYALYKIPENYPGGQPDFFEPRLLDLGKDVQPKLVLIGHDSRWAVNEHDWLTYFDNNCLNWASRGVAKIRISGTPTDIDTICESYDRFFSMVSQITRRVRYFDKHYPWDTEIGDKPDLNNSSQTDIELWKLDLLNQGWIQFIHKQAAYLFGTTPGRPESGRLYENPEFGLVDQWVNELRNALARDIGIRIHGHLSATSLTDFHENFDIYNYRGPNWELNNGCAWVHEFRKKLLESFRTLYTQLLDASGKYQGELFEMGNVEVRELLASNPHLVEEALASLGTSYRMVACLLGKECIFDLRFNNWHIQDESIFKKTRILRLEDIATFINGVPDATEIMYKHETELRTLLHARIRKGAVALEQIWGYRHLRDRRKRPWRRLFYLMPCQDDNEQECAESITMAMDQAMIIPHEFLSIAPEAVRVDTRGEPLTEIDDECNICRDTYQIGRLVMELHCKHRFHPRCIYNWFDRFGKRQNTCPTCRHTPDFYGRKLSFEPQRQIIDETDPEYSVSMIMWRDEFNHERREQHAAHMRNIHTNLQLVETISAAMTMPPRQAAVIPAPTDMPIEAFAYYRPEPPDSTNPEAHYIYQTAFWIMDSLEREEYRLYRHGESWNDFD